MQFYVTWLKVHVFNKPSMKVNDGRAGLTAIHIKIAGNSVTHTILWANMCHPYGTGSQGKSEVLRCPNVRLQAGMWKERSHQTSGLSDLICKIIPNSGNQKWMTKWLGSWAAELGGTESDGARRKSLKAVGWGSCWTCGHQNASSFFLTFSTWCKTGIYFSSERGKMWLRPSQSKDGSPTSHALTGGRRGLDAASRATDITMQVACSCRTYSLGPASL